MLYWKIIVSICSCSCQNILRQMGVQKYIMVNFGGTITINDIWVLGKFSCSKIATDMRGGCLLSLYQFISFLTMATLEDSSGNKK